MPFFLILLLQNVSSCVGAETSKDPPKRLTAHIPPDVNILLSNMEKTVITKRLFVLVERVRKNYENVCHRLREIDSHVERLLTRVPLALKRNRESPKRDPPGKRTKT